MIHRILTIISILSVLLCVGVLVVWVRSYWVADTLRRATDTRVGFSDTRVSSSWGTIYIRRETCITTGPGAADYWSVTARPSLGVSFPGYCEWSRRKISGGYLDAVRDQHGMFPGFHHTHYADQSQLKTPPIAGFWTRNALTVPDWFLALFFAALPVASIVNKRRRAVRLRLSRGLCPSCGYDLRATPDRCPECGHVPEPAKLEGAKT